MHGANKNLLLPMILLVSLTKVVAQTGEEELLKLNAAIELAVVHKNIGLLQEAYAEDFVFTHGTGFVEGKNSWIKNVSNPEVQFVSRKQDSTTVELHEGVALVTGKVDITRKNKESEAVYGIWYIRIYQKKENRWQMISHRTTKEWHVKK